MHNRRQLLGINKYIGSRNSYAYILTVFLLAYEVVRIWHTIAGINDNVSLYGTRWYPNFSCGSVFRIHELGNNKLCIVHRRS